MRRVAPAESAEDPKAMQKRERAMEKAFAESPSCSASLNGDAAILCKLLRKWYGDDALRVAKAVVGGLAE
jgi:hypothetical protein